MLSDAFICSKFYIFGQFYLEVRINSSHFVSPLSLHLLAPVSPRYTCWHNVACCWVIALTADSAAHSSATLPLLLAVIQSPAFARSLHQEVNRKEREPFKTHQHALLLLRSVVWSVCYKHAICTCLSEVAESVLSCTSFVDENSKIIYTVCELQLC